MPSTTSRLALLEPVGADAVSELRLSITNHATTLDNAVTYSQGTLAGRPAAALAGRVYRATDVGPSGTFYEDTGSAWLQVLTFGRGVLAITNQAGNYTASAGDLVNISGGFTVTLPAPSTAGLLVGAVTYGTFSATVATPSGLISGPGHTSGVSSIPIALGTTVVFQSNGTNWQVVSGQQDTGWVALTLTTNATATGSPYWTPAVRVIGDIARLRGAVTTPASATTTLTVPAAAQPVSQSVLGLINFNTNLIQGAIVHNTSATITFGAAATGQYQFDGQSYSLV